MQFASRSALLGAGRVLSEPTSAGDNIAGATSLTIGPKITIETDSGFSGCDVCAGGAKNEFRDAGGACRRVDDKHTGIVMGLFVLPPIGVFTNPKRAGEYSAPCSSYSHYNYLRPGLIQRLKRGRFEVALALAKPFFNSGEALDFGCADGVLLCSLANYFQRVVGVDNHMGYLAVAQDLVDAVPLKNVTLVCNEGLSFNDLGEEIGRKFRVAFLLETLEHVGRSPDLYASKGDFLEGVLSLVEPDGVVIISVPRMVGIRFFIKHMIQRTLRIPRDEVTFGELLRAAFLCDTSRLEPKWNGGHTGFNHQKLTGELRSRFDLLSSRGNLTSIFYVVRARAGVERNSLRAGKKPEAGAEDATKHA